MINTEDFNMKNEPILSAQEEPNNARSPDWLIELTEQVRYASKCLVSDWPDAWLYLGSEPGGGEDFYDSQDTLFELPVYHSPAWLQHSGRSGEHQKIVPLWFGDCSNRKEIMRRFERLLAGDE
jgi:hypothetical protein